MKQVFLTIATCVLVTFASVRGGAADLPPAPTALPAAFFSATNLLFDDGMSDPRGGEYRAIKIRRLTLFRQSEVIATHGWVLPTGQGSGGRRVAAWNGLTYDVVSDSGPADLHADINALLKARFGSHELESSSIEQLSFLGTEFIGDRRAVELTSACLLLRLGETAAASRCYLAARSERADNREQTNSSRNDPLLELSDDYASAIYNRMVLEHCSGADRLAADDSALILQMSRRIETQAASRGSQVSWSSGQAQNAPSYFDFLTCTADILTDSKRRLTTLRPTVSIVGLLSPHRDPHERISLLIDHLDDVTFFQDSSPGSLRFDSDPIVEALVREGDVAVDPLLDAMEHDNRLTRVARRERRRDRSNPVSVSYAAYFCLTRILHTSDFGGTGNATVADIRAYWNANRCLTPADRWFRTLSDDSATPDQWLEAAKNIVAIIGPNDNAIYGRASHQSYGSARPLMQGEALRLRAGPSVSALLVRRVDALANASRSRRGMKTAIDEGGDRFSDSMTLALNLADWDLKASLPTLKTLVRRYVAFVRRTGPMELTDYQAIQVAQMTVARMHAGDSGAAADYVSYIRQFKMPQFVPNQPYMFLPLYEYPENPLLAWEANALFDGTHSNFNPVARPAGLSAGGDMGCDELIGSRLLCVPAFRRQVLRELDDHHLAGNGRMEEKSQVSWNRGGSSGIYTPDPPPDPQRFRVGTTFTFRLCDLYAWEVSRACASMSPKSKKSAAPHFELYWNPSQRDAAVGQMRNYLEREVFNFRSTDFP